MADLKSTHLAPGPAPSIATPLTQVKDLRRGGVTMDLRKLNYNEDEVQRLRRTMAVWVDPDVPQGRHSKGIVWLIYTDELRRDVKLLFNLRSRLREYTIAAEHIADMGQITKIYDRHEQENVSNQRQERRGTDVNAYLDELLEYSIDNDVSDIHIERRRMDSRVRMRMLGHLQTYQAEVSTEFISRMCRAIYDVEAEEEGKDTNFREDKPQPASIARTIKNQQYKLRFQSLPAYPDGFDVVLRVLKVGAEGDMKYTTLEELGYSPDQVLLIQEIVRKPIGTLIVAGVTGSGKSTTLKTLIMWINATREYRCKIYSIEDPPEYRIPGITQMPVRQPDDSEDVSKQVSPFHAPLKAAMRGDPDVIMIGEVRDDITCDGVKKATQSGHQVLTTIHASSSFGIFDRLRDFGLDANTLGSDDFISGVIYQRLAPKLCPNCCIPFMEVASLGTATAELISLGRRLETILGMDSVAAARLQGAGCGTCRNLGVVGRTVCAEVVRLDRPMLRMIRRGEMSDAAQRWRQKSDQDPLSDNMDGKKALEHALAKVAQGLISPVDVELLFGPVDSALREFKEMEEDEALRRQTLGLPASPDSTIPVSSNGRRSPAWSAQG